MAKYQIKQSSSSYALMFLMIDSSDHISAKTGLTPTVTLSKNGGSFASPAGAVSEVGSGWYKVAGNATDAGTLGPLVLHATGSGADPTDVLFEVVAIDPQSTAFGLSIAKTTNITGFNDLDAAGVRSAVGLASANIDTQLTTIDDFLDTEIAAIKAKTDQLVFTSSRVDANLNSTERDAIASALLDLANAIETGVTLRQAIRVALASAAGKLSGAATTTVTLRNVGDTKNRIVATVDADGNRTAVTVDGT